MKNVYASKFKKYTGTVILCLLFMAGFGSVNYDLFKSIDTSKPVESFPYDQFLSTIKPENVSDIRSYKKVMDSLNLPSTKILYDALTTHLKDKDKPAGFDIDYLQARLNLGCRYTDVGDFYTEDAILYKAIGASWFDFVAGKIVDTIKVTPGFSANPAVQGMLARLVDYKANPPSLPASLITKTIYNITNGNWSYLLERTKVASTPLKIALILGLLIFIIEQVIVLRFIIGLIRKK